MPRIRAPQRRTEWMCAAFSLELRTGRRLRRDGRDTDRHRFLVQSLERRLLSAERLCHRGTGWTGNIFATLVAGVALGLLQSLGGVVFGDGYRELVDWPCSCWCWLCDRRVCSPVAVPKVMSQASGGVAVAARPRASADLALSLGCFSLLRHLQCSAAGPVTTRLSLGSGCWC